MKNGLVLIELLFFSLGLVMFVSLFNGVVQAQVKSHACAGRIAARYLSEGILVEALSSKGAGIPRKEHSVPLLSTDLGSLATDCRRMGFPAEKLPLLEIERYCEEEQGKRVIVVEVTWFDRGKERMIRESAMVW